MAEESTLTEQQQDQMRRQLQALLGDDFHEEESLRSQVRKALDQENVRNASSIAAQSSDMMLMDYMRLMYLNNQFENPLSAPSLIQFEMTQLESRVQLDTTAPAAEPYSGPTYNIAEGPAAVTAQNIATAYVEKYGANVAEGPIDHSDSVVTKADIQDAIEKYESVEITDEQIEAYRAESLQELVDSRMVGIKRTDPEYDSKFESANKWASEMAMPTDDVITQALRQERFLEENPDMRLSDEQAQTLADTYGSSNPALYQNMSSVLSLYTGSAEARSNGLHPFSQARMGLVNEVEAAHAAEYESQIAPHVAEIQEVGTNVGAISFSVRGDSHTGIDRDAFSAHEAEMNAAFEGGDYNTALNAANQLNETVIADVDTRQLALIGNNFETLQAAAQDGGYTLDTPADMLNLLRDPEAGQDFKQTMDLNGDARVRGMFQSSEYRSLETTHRDALATRSEIETTAAKYEGVELTEPNTSELTTQGVMEAEIAASPALNLIDVAKGIVADNDGGAKYGIGEAIGHTFGGIDLERLNMTRDIIGFEGVPHYDVTTAEGMTSTLIAMDVYASGEVPSVERLTELEKVVETAFDDDHAVDLDTANIPDAISNIFQRAHDATPAIGNIFAKSVLPEGYEARLQELQGNVNGAPTQEEQAPAIAAAAPGL